MTVVHVCVQTRNKALAVSALHSLLNMTGSCITKNIELQYHFTENKSSIIPKLLKTGDRVVWFDYGVSPDKEILEKMISPFEKEIQVLVFPCVREGVNWEQFRKKTKAGSHEPVNQRGLEFDTTVGRKLAPGLYLCDRTAARIWAMDTKSVNKKLRTCKEPVKLPEDPEAMFARLAEIGVKIGVATEAEILCHFVHECKGNILESSGLEFKA